MSGALAALGFAALTLALGILGIGAAWRLAARWFQ